MTRWLIGTDLFEQAWRRVCEGTRRPKAETNTAFKRLTYLTNSGPLNWWWSEQLCIFTVGIWTTFLFVQGKSGLLGPALAPYGPPGPMTSGRNTQIRVCSFFFTGSQRRIPFVWAYMLLGQFVAISVASNLFFAAVVLHRPTSSDEQDSKPALHKPKPALEQTSTSKQTLVPLRVYVPILLSHLTILVSPTVAVPDSRWFLPNLLVMHLLLVIPLLNLTAPPVPTRFSISSHTFYLLLAALALVPRAQTLLSLSKLGYSNSGLLQGLWSTLHEHPAQSSIGYDVVWTTISFAIYCMTRGGMIGGMLGLTSPGLALYLDDE